VAPAIKVIVWDCVFWPWAARGLSGSFEHVIDCCQDYNSHVSKEFEPWKKVSPAIKVIVWDCDFLALGSQRPFWQPEAFMGACLSRFESGESGALFRKNKRFTREGSKKRGFSRARKRYSSRVVQFLEKTSVLVERGRKNAASAEHGSGIHREWCTF
jgi:hypothetical protein